MKMFMKNLYFSSRMQGIIFIQIFFNVTPHANIRIRDVPDSERMN